MVALVKNRVTMLFPTDPEKCPIFLTKFTEKMVSGEIVFLIHCAEVTSDANHQSILAEGAVRLVDSFRLADIVRFGVRGGQPLGPYFAFTLVTGTAHLIGYAVDRHTDANREAAVQEALQSLALNLFFQCKLITQISLPFILPEWKLKEWKRWYTKTE